MSGFLLNDGHKLTIHSFCNPPHDSPLGSTWLCECGTLWQFTSSRISSAPWNRRFVIDSDRAWDQIGFEPLLAQKLKEEREKEG